MKVSALYLEKIGDKGDNVKRLFDTIEQELYEDSKIVVSPELGVSGFGFSRQEEIIPFCETVPGETTELFESLARRYKGYVAIGLPEIESDNTFNTVALLGPGGYLGKYRQRRREYVYGWTTGFGTSDVVFNTDHGNMGILLCSEMIVSEFMCPTAAKSDIILIPSSWNDEGGLEEVWIDASRYGKPIVIGNRGDIEDRGGFEYDFSNAKAAIITPTRIYSGKKTIRVFVEIGQSL